MRSLCRFVRTAGPLQKPFQRHAARSFTATAQVQKYQVPKFQNQREPTMATTTLKGQPFDRPVLDSMLRRRMFYTPSFEVYGGVGGLFDYGPVRNLSLCPCSELPIFIGHEAALAPGLLSAPSSSKKYGANTF